MHDALYYRYTMSLLSLMDYQVATKPYIDYLGRYDKFEFQKQLNGYINRRDEY